MKAKMQEVLELRRSPNILTVTNRNDRRSDRDRVIEIDTINTRWIAAESAERERLFDNLMAFFDIHGGAWAKEDLVKLRSEGRHPVSFNIAEQKLRTLAGSIQSEKWDYEYLPLNNKHTTLTKGIKHWYFADKEQYNYAFAENKTLLRGLIHSGVEEMEIRYDIRPTGAISFRPCLPGTVLQDPYWQSDDLKDWKRAIKHAWMTAQEMIEYFDISDPEIEVIAAMDKQSGHWYDPVNNVDDFENVPSTWGSKYLVIEYRYIEELKTTRLHGRRPDGTFVPFPVDIKEDEVRDVMDLYGIESAEDLREYPYEDQILKYTTIAPRASSALLLADGTHPTQCGYIGFFPFSAAREMGINKGVMESILDIQRTLNYRESKKDDVIAAAASGAMAVNVDKLDNAVNAVRDLKQNKTRPDFVLPVHGDPSNLMAPIPTTEVPHSILQDIGSLIEMFDRVTPVTPALEGASTSDESGILFEMRHAVTKLGILLYHDNWMSHLSAKAEAWYNQASITYRGLYQKVDLADKPGFIEFNSPRYMGDQKSYLNSVEFLPRARVVVSLSRTSPTEQFAKRAMLLDMSKMLSANPEMAKQQFRVVMNQMIKTLDLSPEERVKYETMGELQEQIDVLELFTQREGLMASMLSSKVNQGQAMMMLQQLQGAMGQALGGGEQVPEALSQASSGSPGELPGGGAPAAPLIGPEGPSNAPGQPVETRRGEFQP